MRKYILVLFVTWCSLAAWAQTTEKIKFSVRDNDTDYSIKASFPAERAERLQSILEGMLGETGKSSNHESLWTTSAYSAKFSATRFEANLDKKKASGHQIALFKELTEKLQAALDQPKPPKPPKQP